MSWEGIHCPFLMNLLLGTQYIYVYIKLTKPSYSKNLSSLIIPFKTDFTAQQGEGLICGSLDLNQGQSTIIDSIVCILIAHANAYISIHILGLYCLPLLPFLDVQLLSDFLAGTRWKETFACTSKFQVSIDCNLVASMRYISPHPPSPKCCGECKRWKNRKGFL